MIRQIDDELYEIISSWWADVDSYTFPKELLPRHSYVVFKEDKPIVAGILYKEEKCKFGMLGWIISNPDSVREDRDECIEILLNHIFDKAKEEGIGSIFTVMKHHRLVEKLKERGFVEISNDSIHLFKVF